MQFALLELLLDREEAIQDSRLQFFYSLCKA